ncbi:DUF485 domain-containing protein [Jeotgalibacillus soli]|uniref:DUF485 domain-containing protein n=1 Tax=Jeotgalibacillus soli TaxID=889306 RepID=A0A0C2VYX8_9BACL|nr:DUF485 domain-containing protein [Jeotgalibacillus soli]KIL49596.1 hypothetical protein KP78_10640 [Jeotgalibacillus soli]
MTNRVQKSSQKQQKVQDFEKIARSSKYLELTKAKKRFLVPSVIIFFSLYLLFPILTSYTTFLNTPAIGVISWTWLYALSLFIMTWVLVTIYMKRAAVFDKMAEEVLKENGVEGGQDL